MRLSWLVHLMVLLANLGCSAVVVQGDGGVGARDAGEGDAGADWVLAVDPAAPRGLVTPALLGHYDLSGSLYDYPANAVAVERLKALGFAEWRVGVGRWEVATRLLPTRTDGSSCAPFLDALPASLRAPANATDLTLLADRDWFTDDSKPVTKADTLQDGRYSLGYLRSVLDAAEALGASAFVDVDLMPRALARQKTFRRVGSIVGLVDPCLGSFSNGVSNGPPADPAVFAAAVRGLVQRVVEGSAGERPRAASRWELWNEFELGYAWVGTTDEYFTMVLSTLVELDAYRAASSKSSVRALRFGLGSFAFAATAAAVLHTLDTTPLPGGAFAAVDFFSFHAYDNDPLVILAQVQQVSAARAASLHYRDAELVLSEWGPNLEHSPPSQGLEVSLLVATVLARLPALGVTRAHHSILLDFAEEAPLPYSLLSHGGERKPLYEAYSLFHALIGGGAQRLEVVGVADGSLSGGLGAVLAVTRGAEGRVSLSGEPSGDGPHRARRDRGAGDGANASSGV